MIVVDIARLAVLVLALLVTLGGVIGFWKAKSKPSLIAGVVSGMLLALSYRMSMADPLNGLKVADALAALVGIMFAVRLVKTRKFMPGGVGLILCLASVALSTAALLQSH